MIPARSAPDLQCIRAGYSIRSNRSRAAKIASRVGVAEVALVRRQGDAFAPLAIGDLPLQSLCAATHAMIIAAGSEGHASGEWVDAFPLPGVEAGP